MMAQLSKVLLMSIACLGLKGLAVRVVARTRRMIAARATVACRLCGSSSICPAFDAITGHKPAARCSTLDVNGHAKSSCDCHVTRLSSAAFANAALNVGISDAIFFRTNNPVTGALGVGVLVARSAVFADSVSAAIIIWHAGHSSSRELAPVWLSGQRPL